MKTAGSVTLMCYQSKEIGTGHFKRFIVGMTLAVILGDVDK